jgi:hypothetical protein
MIDYRTCYAGRVRVNADVEIYEAVFNNITIKVCSRHIYYPYFNLTTTAQFNPTHPAELPSDTTHQIPPSAPSLFRLIRSSYFSVAHEVLANTVSKAGDVVGTAEGPGQGREEWGFTS